MSFAYLSFRTKEEFNDLSYGKFGRYLIKNGEIKVEMYMDKQDGVIYMYAKPILLGIQFYKVTASGFGQFMKVRRGTDGGLYEKHYIIK